VFKFNNRTIFSLFLLLFSTVFFVFPSSVFAEIKPEDVKDVSKVELKENDAQLIIRTLIQELSDKWIEVASSAESLEKEAAVIVVRNGAKTDTAHYLMIDLPQEMGKNAITATLKIANLLLVQDLSDVINEIEKVSVQKANSYLMELLTQNQMKISSGNMPVSYQNNNYQWERFSLPYIIAYKQLTNNQAYVAIGFYSSKVIKAPGLLLGMQWTGGINEIPPFILRVKGIVQSKSGGYEWLGNPYIEVIFDEPVPYFDFPEPTLWQKIKDYFKNLMPDFSFLKADVGQELANSLSNLSPKLDFSNIDISVLNNNSDTSDNSEQKEQNNNGQNDDELTNPGGQNKDSESQNEIVNKQKTIEEIQDELDDIAEKIDILRQKINDYIAVQQQNNENDDLAENNSNNEEEQSSKKSSKITSGAGSSSTRVEINYCQKSVDSAALQGKVIINEVAWMGTDVSSSNEWIELKNISSESINLFGWQILDKEKQIKIVFPNSAVIIPGGFYLLERTNDDSVSNVLADFIYTGSLSDSNEALYLFDNNCQLQDEVLADKDWPAGEKDEKKTMERSDNLSWHTYSGEKSNGIMGTPKTENSKPLSDENGEKKPTEPEMQKILISEIQASENEFIELYNPNSNPVDISNFYLSYYSSERDWNSPYRNKQFPVNSQIIANGYYLIGLDGFPITGGNPNSDWQPYDDSQLSSSSGAIAIFNCDPKGKEIEETQLCKIDAVGWSSALVFEKQSYPAIADNQSLSRKTDLVTPGYQDTDSNADDFEIQNPSPTNSKGETFYEMTFFNSVWPMFRQNPKRNCQSTYKGPTSQPIVKWIYSEGSNFNNSSNNPLYTPLILDDSGVLFSSVIFPVGPTDKTGLLALNLDGTKKYFKDGFAPSFLLGKEKEILFDDKINRGIADDGSYYYGEKDTIYAFAKDGVALWERKIEYKNPEGKCNNFNNSPEIVNPITVGNNGDIYTVAKDLSCDSLGDNVDGLYIISSQNEIISEILTGRYNTTSACISNEGIAYVTNLVYGKYSSGPSGYLAAMMKDGTGWDIEISHERSPVFFSLPTIDADGNIYISVDKTVLAFDKLGNKLWEVYLIDTPADWNVSNTSIVISADGTLYITGRGAIVALK
jgi:hypothetical protein